MALLSKATSGYIDKKYLWVCHSAPGVGKTTLASKFGGLLIDLENGSAHVDVKRLTTDEVPDYKSLLQVVDELPSSGLPAVTIDSATVLEAYIHREICGDRHKSIDDLGYGAGYTKAREMLQHLMQKLQLLTKKMHVIITAHSQVKTFNDPLTGSSYDRFLIQTHVRFAEILTSAADNVLFLKHLVDTSVDSKTKKTQAFSSGKRVIMPNWSHAFEAKNRLGLYDEIPLDYAALQAAIENSKPRSPEQLIKEIKNLISRVDEATRQLATAKMKEVGNDATALLRIKQKLSEMIQP